MNHVALWAIPTTGQDRLESLVRYFQNPGARSGTNELWGWVVLVVAVLALGAMVGQWLFARPGKTNRPWRLFFALCRRHRLSWSERWTLWQLARSCTPQMPARVFLDPDLFRPEQLPAYGTKRAALLEQLRRKLFPQLPSGEKSFAGQPPRTPGCSENQVAQEPPVGFPRELCPSLDWPGWRPANGTDGPKISPPTPVCLETQSIQPLISPDD